MRTSSRRPIASLLLSLLLPIAFTTPSYAIEARNEDQQSRELINSLSPEDLDRALEKVWARPYQSPQTDDSSASRREALFSSLAHFGAGAAILQKPITDAEEDAQDSFFQELLPGKIGFVRLGKLISDRETKLNSALRDFEQLSARGLILDLRASNAGGSLKLAAALASPFVPPDTLLFKTRDLVSQKLEEIRSKKGTLRNIPLAVLINSRTSGGAEALAASLQLHGKAFVIGQITAGAVGDYSEVNLSGGRVLRLPQKEVLFEKYPDFSRRGLPPDLAVNANAEMEMLALSDASSAGKVSHLLTETRRPRLNEAALMARQNPETESWIRDQLAKKSGSHAAQKPPRDETLIRAADFIEAVAATQP